MLLKVFRENQSISVLFLFLLSIVVWALVVFQKAFEPGVYTLYNYSGFYLFPSLRSINNNIGLSVALNVLLILISGYYFSRITVRYQLLPGRNLMPMLSFFFMSMPWFVINTGFSYALLTLPVLLYVIDKLFQSAESKRLSYSYFNCAMILSAASIINYFLALYLVFILFLFFRLRGMFWREMVFVIIGAILPYIFLFSLMYLFDADMEGFVKSLDLLKQYRLTFEMSSFIIAFSIFLAMLFLLSSWQAMNQYVKMKILTRKYSVAIFGFFVLSAIITFFIPSISRDSLFYLAIPLSFLFGFYFTKCRANILNQVFFLIFLGGNAFIFFYSFFVE